MFRSRIYLMVTIVFVVASTHFVSTSAEAQLFRMRRANQCCPTNFVPMNTTSFRVQAPIQMVAPNALACCGNSMVVASPMMSGSVMSGSMMASPMVSYPTNSCCGAVGGNVIGNMYPIVENGSVPVFNQTQVIDGTIINGPIVDNSSLIGPDIPEDQSCMSKYTTCVAACSGCSGADYDLCKDYCKCKKRNCPKPPLDPSRENCGIPPLCYTGPGGL